MPERVKVIGPAECPRCGAIAKMKAKSQNSKSDALAVVIVCDKCKKETMVGVTSRGQMARQERHAKLLKLYKEAKTPLQRGKIMKEMQKISNQEDTFMNGISFS